MSESAALPVVRELDAVPSASALYPRALAASLRPALRRVPVVGALAGRAPSGLPEVEHALPAVQVDRAHLLAYDRVCGFRLRDALPPTYLHVVAFPLSLQIMTRSDFPFPAIGLVHVENRIEVLRSVDRGEQPALRVWAADLREHPRGRQFDLRAEATVAAEPVWRSASTYLRREGGGGGGGRSGGGDDGDVAREPGAVWRVPADIGRRYAAVSGDTNPIHLHPLTARLFGMPRPIAHGMWLKARCLAALESSLPAAYEAEVRFKLPVRLPSKVGFAAWREGEGRAFALEDRRSGRAHMTGAVRPRS